MERIKKLKDEAYKIATQTYKSGYNYSAEKMTDTKKEG